MEKTENLVCGLDKVQYIKAIEFELTICKKGLENSRHKKGYTSDTVGNAGIFSKRILEIKKVINQRTYEIADEMNKRKKKMIVTKEDYKTAVQVQGAYNLCGIVNSMSAVLDRVWQEAREKGLGIEYVNRHPISILFASKISDLSKMGAALSYKEALEKCVKRSE